MLIKNELSQIPYLEVLIQKIRAGAMGAHLSQPMEVILMFNKNGNCCPVAARGFNMMTGQCIHSCMRFVIHLLVVIEMSMEQLLWPESVLGIHQ